MPCITKRQVRRTRSDLWDWYEDENPQQTAITVHEERDARPTGVLNQNGDELFLVPERVSMGFRK